MATHKIDWPSDMGAEPLTLDRVAARLDWPEAPALLHPIGAGAAVFAGLVREKIGRGLAGLIGPSSFRAGILAADPDADGTEPPIAILVEFTSAASPNTLRELHRLAWNFSHSPTLITVEPDIVRVWTCCETPDAARPLQDFEVHQIAAEALEDPDHALERRATRALHWLNLVSGDFFVQHPGRFDRDGRADQLLLRNLRHIRAILSEQGLSDDDVCHDLLARVIFVQFLFDRRDADGKPALNADSLKRLHADGVLSQRYMDFGSILSDYEDAYRLFAWLNARFNGDLFPGKGDTPDARAAGWALEQLLVRPHHLALLADFIRGDLDMPSGQGCLWPIYSFDVIPLEFISSIYETFVTERAARDGIFYTPPHLVDFVLDQVLPWRGTEWNLRILDPACGSGIFLVKAFQRLVHRWKQAHPGQFIRADDLRGLLTDNLLGVDRDPHAVRVACFSLYLAMCDEIEPRHYWTQIRFPSMRGRRLICSDFFASQEGFDSSLDAGQYDLVIGNAPWGDGLATPLSNEWAAAKDWEVANKDIGGLFLAKAACLVNDRGRVAMIQSANALLFNASGPASRFRKQLFARHRVEAIFNLSALRFRVFKRKTHTTKTSIAPACVVILRAAVPHSGDILIYASPKALEAQIEDFAIVIEPHHVHRPQIADVAEDPVIWTTLMWGTPRDVQLLRKLSRFPRFARWDAESGIRTREGVVFGDQKKLLPELDGRHLFTATRFPSGTLLEMDARSLPVIEGLRVHSRDSTDFQAFSATQLLIKQGYQTALGRFQARLVRNMDARGVICSQSYVTAAGPAPIMHAACLAYNSRVATYVLQLTSGRMAAYRPEATVHDLLDVPIPPPERLVDNPIKTLDDIDEAVYFAFGLKDAERALVEDMATITIPDFRGDRPSPGAQRTVDQAGRDTKLVNYCEHFIKVLKAGFGRSRRVGAIIFAPPPEEPFPYRLAAFQLLSDNDGKEPIRIRNISHSDLIVETRRLSQGAGSGTHRLLGRRIARFYDASSGIPTVFIFKPDAVRYWTRTMALNDADQVASDLFQWQASRMEHAAS